MTHGAPDNYQVKPSVTTYKLDDMAELAERIGAVQSIDRLGDVIFIEDFGDGLSHWNTATAGAGTTVTESGAWSSSGGFSAKIHLPADVTANAKIYKALPFPVTSKIGLEFCLTSDEHAEVFIGYMTFYTNTLKISYALKFDIPGGKVYYLSPLGTWVLVSTEVYVSYASGIFHRGKYVVDLTKLIYYRYKTATGAVKLSDLSPFIIADTTRAHLYTEFYFQGSAAGEIDVYLDSIIITQNEP